MITVYVVQLLKPYRGVRQFVFGSIAALYETIPEIKIGISKRKIMEREKICTKGVFVNEKVNIVQSKIIRSVKKK